MIFVMRGTSCSGKDTFCGKMFPPHTVVSSDAMRLMLTNDMKDQNQNAQVFDFIRKIVEFRLQMKVPFTVVNSTNLKFKDVHQYIDLAEKFGENVSILSIDPPDLTELMRRRDMRSGSNGLYVPDHVLERHHNSYYSCMDRFVEAVDQYSNLLFTRIDQDWNVIK